MEYAGGTSEPFAPYGPCYGEEAGCDIVFLAGREDDIWRLPAHQLLLTRENPVFGAMFSPTFLSHRDSPGPHTIRITDVEGRALDNLLRFLYNEPVPLQSVDTALVTLQAADKYICRGLARVCISYLSENLSQSNVLTVLRFIRVYCGGDYQNLENLAKEKDFHQGVTTVTLEAKSPEGNNSGPYGVVPKLQMNCVEPDNIELDCAGLLFQCLKFVDRSGDAILASEEWEELDLSAVGLILARDTLNVKDELVVYSALKRWADKECKRQQLPLTPPSKRQVLSESIFLPRYLTMTLAEFESIGGPAQSGLFALEELAVLFRIFKDGLVPVTTSPTSRSTIDGEKAKRLFLFVSNHAPASLRSHIVAMACPRSPQAQPDELHSPPAKVKRVPFLQRWLGFKGCCHPSRGLSTPESSPHSSPVRSSSVIGNASRTKDPPSAGDQGTRRRASSEGTTRVPASPPQRSACDLALERVVLCWAFFFD